MKKNKVVIIGAGLSGLYAAYLLKQKGIDSIILESRDRIGGRILTSQTTRRGESEYYDLGPSWFWPGMNRRIESLVKKFSLNAFTQHEEGNYLIDEAKGAPPKVIPGIYVNTPSSYRIEGGMYALVNAVFEQLNPEQVELNAQVTRVSKDNNSYIVTYERNEDSFTVEADYVITALPLRILVDQIGFSPELPENILNAMVNTPTWMAAHAKLVAVYEKPFWREDGNSGTASSRLGPLVEIHDATVNGGKGAGALFGFIGYNAQTRKTAGEEKLKSLAVEQLTRIFGEQAAKPLDVQLVDWSQETETAPLMTKFKPCMVPMVFLLLSMSLMVYLSQVLKRQEVTVVILRVH